MLFRSEEKVNERVELESARNAARERQAALKVENEQLKTQMDELKARIDELEKTEGAECPLCGQPLSTEHREATLKQLEAEGKEKGDQYRANTDESKSIAKQVTEYEARITKLNSAENERVKYASEISQLTERMETLQALAKDWETTGKKRLKEVEKLLDGGKYAADEQKQLAKLDKELAKLGYDASAHDEARKKESELRNVEEEHANLRSAKEVSKQIESEIENLEEEIENRKSEIANLESEYLTAKTKLEEIGRASCRERVYSSV